MKVELSLTPASVSGTVPSSEAENRVARTHAERDARVRELVDAHLDFVWRLLRRSGVPADRVDDATQQVFLVATARLAHIAAGSERSFLFGTALRVASTVRRSQNRRRDAATEDELLARHADPGPLPDELADLRRGETLLDAILSGMEEELRVVFVLYELEAMTAPEIAALVGAPLGTVASRLRRARERFREVSRELTRAKGDLP